MIPGGQLVSASGQTLTLPTQMGLRGGELKRSLPVLDLAGLDGAVLAGKRSYSSRNLSLQGVYPQSGLDDLRALLNDSPLELHTQGRYLLCEFAGMQDGYYLPLYRSVSVVLVALDPFWCAEIPTVATVALPTGGQFHHTNPGNIAAYPVVSVSAHGKVTIRNLTSSDWFTYTPELTGNYELILDCERFTAKVGTTNVLKYLDSGFLNGFRLLPGDNLLEYAGGDAGNLVLQVAYTPRWL